MIFSGCFLQEMLITCMIGIKQIWGPHCGSRPARRVLGLLGARARCSATLAATQPPRPQLMQCLAGEKPWAALPQPWAYRSSHSLAPLQAMMGQVPVPCSCIKTGWADFSDHCVPLSWASVWIPSFPDCSPTRTRSLLQGDLQMSPPRSALWMPLL